MKAKINLLLGILVLCLALVACRGNTVVNEYKPAPVVGLVAGESVVVLGRRHSTQYETELDYIDCVGKALSSGDKDMNVIPEKLFVDTMYPYFEPSTAPMDVSKLDQLVQEPAVAKKFADFRIRYFIWIDGNTETTEKKGSMTCAVGPGGGGCFGFTKWDDTANYEASIWDFNELALSGKISTETEGTSYMPAVIVPIPLLARVKAQACTSMASQIKDFLQ